MYAGWSNYLPDDVEVLALQLPGHEDRRQEPLATDLASLARGLRATIEALSDLPFSFFGHSMGAVLAFELACSLRRAGLPLPEHLLVAASNPPDLLPRHPLITALTDEDLVDVLRTLSAAPLLFDDPELVRVLVPVLRTDLSMLQTYEPRLESPLPVPITVYGGTGDPSARPEVMAGWKRFSTASFSLVTLPGGHFFIRDVARLLPLIGVELEGLTTPEAPLGNDGGKSNGLALEAEGNRPGKG